MRSATPPCARRRSSRWGPWAVKPRSTSASRRSRSSAASSSADAAARARAVGQLGILGQAEPGGSVGEQRRQLATRLGADPPSARRRGRPARRPRRRGRRKSRRPRAGARSARCAAPAPWSTRRASLHARAKVPPRAGRDGHACPPERPSRAPGARAGTRSRVAAPALLDRLSTERPSTRIDFAVARRRCPPRACERHRRRPRWPPSRARSRRRAGPARGRPMSGGSVRCSRSRSPPGGSSCRRHWRPPGPSAAPPARHRRARSCGSRVAVAVVTRTGAPRQTFSRIGMTR